MKNIFSVFIIFCFSMSLEAQSIYYDLSQMNKNELRIARNTVFAKYGREFKTQQMKEYFESQLWYSINPQYSDQLLTDSEKDLIRIIQIWEKSELVWNQNIDLDNDNKIDYCYGFIDKEANKIILIVNNKSKTYKLNWQDSHYWGTLKFSIVDINQNDRKKEIWISQYQKYEEDPNLQHIFVSKNRERLISSDLDVATGYSAGDVSFLNNGRIIINISNCPYHTKTFKLANHKLIFLDEEIGEEPPEGCPACFVSSSEVLLNHNKSIKISELSIGDTILSYDIIKEIYNKSVVLEIVSVEHDNIVELYFTNDTIISTTDHPYFLLNKGWSSFDPKSTKYNYKNYNNVNRIEVGDYFFTSSNKKNKLEGYAFKNQQRQTFTITNLDLGNTFFVNGFLVGVEEICSKYSLKNSR